MEQAAKFDGDDAMDRPEGDRVEGVPAAPLNLYQKTLIRFDVATTIAIAVAAVAFPFSASVVVIATGVMLLCWPCSGHWAERYERIKSQPVLWLPILLLVLLAIGTLYSAANWDKVFEKLISYRKLLYPAMIATTLTVPWRRKLVLGVFQIAMVVALTIMIWFNLPMLIQGNAGRLGSGVRNYMTTGLLIILWMTQIYYLTKDTRFRWWGAAAVGLILLTLVTLNTARTIHVVLLLAIAIALLYRFRMRGILIGLAVIIIMPTTAYFVLPRLKHRVDEVVTQARDFFEHDKKDTSIGVRLNFYRDSMRTALERPIFGYGTGGTVAVLKTDKGKPTDDPHCEYINLYLQLGIIGLAVFLAWLISLVRTALRMPAPWGPMAMTITAIVAIGCIPNSFISVTSEGSIFLFFIGVFYSMPPEKKEIDDNRQSS